MTELCWVRAFFHAPSHRDTRLRLSPKGRAGWPTAPVARKSRRVAAREISRWPRDEGNAVWVRVGAAAHTRSLPIVACSHCPTIPFGRGSSHTGARWSRTAAGVCGHPCTEQFFVVVVFSHSLGRRRQPATRRYTEFLASTSRPLLDLCDCSGQNAQFDKQRHPHLNFR